ncbi:MAG: TraB/GumN family protein [Akkermansiaceae bacterium]|jgi:uncharacterized protein YbaP (TraB family)
MKLLVIPLLAQLVLAAFAGAEEKKAKPADLSKLKHPVNPALFKIEGKGLKKPSYLFGTIHIGDPRVTTFHPEAEKAFTSADHVYGEIDMNPAKMLGAARMMMRSDNKTLSKSIGPELSKELNQFIKGINPALNTAPFESMKTWVMVMQLPLLQLQLEGGEALDAVLQKRARKDKKTVAGLETVESQLKIFNDLKEEEQVMMLKSTLELLVEEKKDDKNPTQELIDLYLTGTIPDFGDYILKMSERGDQSDEKMNALNEKIMKQLFDDRNIKMADGIAKALEKEPGDVHFFAVGAGHYVGETAVQKLLIKKGYKITPLFN